MNEGIYQIEIDEALTAMCHGCPCITLHDDDYYTPPYEDCPLNMEPKIVFVESDFTLRCERRESEKEDD